MTNKKRQHTEIKHHTNKQKNLCLAYFAAIRNTVHSYIMNL